MITLTVNGKLRQAPASLTLSEFLQTLAIKSQFVAVGYNGEVLDKEDFTRVTLKDGDVLEIVRPVGGG
jgi:sulfur carrier protein